jgi:hypothetical protein
MSTLELSQSGPGPLRRPAETAELTRLHAVSNTADTAVRVSTAAVVLAVAGIAAYISYWHAYAVVREYGESGVTALLEPGTIDGLVYASSMVILHAARHRLPVPRLARWMLALGIAASLAVNVAQGWSHGLVGAAAAAWPAVALVGSYEMLAWMVRTTAGGGPGRVPEAGHAVPQPDLPGSSRWPDVYPEGENVTAVAPAGASLEPQSAHEPARAFRRRPGKRTRTSWTRRRGPGEPSGRTSPGKHRTTWTKRAISPRTGHRHGTSRRHQCRRNRRIPHQSSGGQAAVRAQAGSGIRQDLTAVGARPDGRSQAGTGCGLTE